MKTYCDKNLLLPAKTIFACPFFPPSGKNLLNLLRMYISVHDTMNEMFNVWYSMTTVVYCKKTTELCIDEARSLLQNIDISGVSTQTAHKPKGGEVYVYGYDSTTTRNGWVADGYRWYSVGCDRLPRRQPVLYKRKFQTLKSTGPSCAFKRVAYSPFEPGANQYILVQYIGDETVAEDLPHGSVKNREEARPFERTAPSVSAHQTAGVKVRSSELSRPSGHSEDERYNKSYYCVKVNKRTCDTCKFE